jgi:transcriptional regulator with XRE-family HTH domain
VELGQERARLHLTREDVANALNWSPSMLIDIENGVRGISSTDLRVLLFHYKVTDEDRVEELVRMASAENDQVWQQEIPGGHLLGFPGVPPVPRFGQPLHRSIFAVDIEQSTEQNNSAKVALRKAMYDLLEESMVVSGITPPHREPFVDRGDGILTLIHPVDDVPKTLLLSAVIPMLERLLAEYAERCPDQRLRLRAVVHAGEVHFDGHGWFGEALDVAFRLLDAPEVKARFRKSERPLLLVVSDDIYSSVVRHGYAGIDMRAFAEVASVKVAGRRHRSWVRDRGSEEV